MFPRGVFECKALEGRRRWRLRQAYVGTEAIDREASNLENLENLKWNYEAVRLPEVELVFSGGLRVLLIFPDHIPTLDFSQDRNLSLARVCVLVSSSSWIDESMNLKWANSSFTVWVVRKKSIGIRIGV
ncbi:hypothetical protein QVD17_08984 [Tagetes erecta]|uniref:Uncharacterized protein n=1 Tax=Tagetes erecta TaxID=13708 RepID=A0AAD8P3I3_TARER|nr:hypothetical protein QVD17_08984 [Tagetes erecta]